MSADDFKIALFLDTANWRKRSRAAGAYDCDFSNHYSTARVIFTENLQPFFETLPRDRWYRIMGRPVVQVWGVNPAGGFSQHRGFMRERLEWVADECERRYGASERPNPQTRTRIVPLASLSLREPRGQGARVSTSQSLLAPAAIGSDFGDKYYDSLGEKRELLHTKHGRRDRGLPGPPALSSLTTNHILAQPFPRLYSSTSLTSDRRKNICY